MEHYSEGVELMSGGEYEEVASFEGRSGSVGPTGLGDEALDPRRVPAEELTQLQEGRMQWSLGFAGDLLWMLIPEMRPALAEIAIDEINDAVEAGRFLQSLPVYQIISRFQAEALRIALDDYPDSCDLLARCCIFLNRILDSNLSSAEFVRDALFYRVISDISVSVDLPIIAQHDGELAAKLLEWSGDFMRE